MAPEDGATSTPRNMASGGGGGSCSRTNGGQVLKKGPWTAAEDAILMEYVKKNGEGNWNAVQRNSGLMRCGKSCRLRWANHLRPNLKKGAFTPEEERQIIELHSKFGNKWARMALHLQGRTDNEIKNYWNTRLKRRLRAGLPIYPVDFQHHHRRHHEQSLQNQTIPFSSSSPSSSHAKTAINSISPLLYDPLNYPVMNMNTNTNTNTPFYIQNTQSNFKTPHPNTQYPNRNSSISFLNQGFPSSLQSNHPVIQIPKIEPAFDDVRLFENVEKDIPSIQSLFRAITPTCSSNTANDHLIVQSNDGDNAISAFVSSRGNSGLLEDVLGESRALISSCKLSETDTGIEKMTHEYPLMEEPENVTLDSVFETGEANKTTLDDSSSGHSSIEIGGKSQSDVIDEMNTMDEDFSSWLDFPTGWYGGGEDQSNEKPVDVSNGNMVGVEHQVEIACSPVATTETDHDHEWTMGSCRWNNMPGFS
ncbi:putative transcription factor MYB-HB-like family [Helianthus anomalus]